MSLSNPLEMDVNGGITKYCFKKINGSIDSVILHGLDRHMNDDMYVNLMITASERADLGWCTFNDRGHGTDPTWVRHKDGLTGWQRSCDDMIELCRKLKIEKFIAGGQSMGCATSVEVAMRAADKIRALVLMRPPTIWECRSYSKGRLRLAASRTSDPIKQKAYLEASETNFSFTPEELQANLSTIPTLILAIPNDKVHPMESAERIHSLLPNNSKLVVAETEEAAASEWPAVIEQFLKNVATSHKL
eukprot:TRINITY_DN31398_c0_g1_i1.p1 TRINITY_DN31398_c0_g1~~TRINITY_DN31398_c0_g1_i1.p1  ORF type:complete len:247 (+),score=21.79 TRINITY_DN31398_c0_g1_i1:158-898(+)